MEKIQVYYYTRTGRSEAIAKKIAEKHCCEAFKIEDDEKWEGVLGFIKGGAKASKGDSTNAVYQKPDEEKDIVLVFPVWAGKYPPAVNSFLKEIDKKRVVLIPTSLKTKFKERDEYKKVIDLIGKDISQIEIEL